MPSLNTVTQERMGVWGARTASIDWCEDNYTTTVWIAEFWNTVSNISMIIPPIYGLYNAYNQKLERRYMIAYLLLLLVGIGSSMFHMTLQYSMQLLDELPMMFTTCVFIYCMAQIKAGPEKSNYILMMMLFLYSAAFVAIYMVWTNPLVMESMYGVLVVVLIVQCAYLVYKERDPGCLKLFGVGTFMYALAFLLWNIDNNFCSTLQDFRASAPAGLGVLSQLHAWWHLLAGYSTYIHIVFSSHYRLSMLRRRPKFVLCPIGISVEKS